MMKVSFKGDFKDVLVFQSKVTAVTLKGTCETPNPVIGERIAEARAKIKVYKFMHTLCKKLMYHYYGILYGVPEGIGELHTKVISDHQGGLQEACNKYATLWLKESQHLGKLMKDL